jgi:hypothetical protein
MNHAGMIELLLLSLSSLASAQPIPQAMNYTQADAAFANAYKPVIPLSMVGDWRVSGEVLKGESESIELNHGQMTRSKHVRIELEDTANGGARIVVSALDKPKPIDPVLVTASVLDDGRGVGKHGAWLAGDYFHFEAAYQVEAIPLASLEAEAGFQRLADSEGWGSVYRALFFYRRAGFRFFFDCAGLDLDHQLCALTLKANLAKGVGADFGRVGYWLLERQP